MLDSVAWAALTSSDPRRVPAPVVNNEFDVTAGAHITLTLGGILTLPPGTDSVRVTFENGPLGDSVKPARGLGFTPVIPYGGTGAVGDQIVFVDDARLPLGVRAPEDVKDQISKELFFPSTSESVIVEEPDVEGSGDYLIAFEIGTVYVRKDLAEIIHAITSWHVDDVVAAPNTNARAQLSRSAFLAFSLRMADPRYRQAHTVWSQPEESIGEFVARCLQGSDALAFWGGYDESGDPVWGFGIGSRRTGDLLPYTIEITEDDPGRSAFVIGDPQVSWSDINVVNNYRRVMGSLISQETTFVSTLVGGRIESVRTERVTEALDGDINVASFVDAVSRSLYGDMPLEEVFETLADARSATGDFRIGTISRPGPELVLGMGPLMFDFFCHERVAVNAPVDGIDSAEQWMVLEQTFNFDTFTGTVVAERVTDVTPELDPDDLDDCILWLRADTGLTTGGGDDSVITWLDQSGQGNDAGFISGLMDPPRQIGAVLNGTTTLRLDSWFYGALEIPAFDTGTDEEQSFLVVALVRLWADNGTPRPLFSTAGAVHDNHYVWLDGAKIEVRAVSDTLDGLTVRLGADAVQWLEDYGYADVFSVQPDPPTAVTLTPTTATNGSTSGLPLDEWRIVVVELYRAANTRPSTGRTIAYQHQQEQAYVATIDPVTGELDLAAQARPYGVGGRAHALDRSVTVGVKHAGVATAADYDSYDLAELAVFARPTTSLPWTPEQIEGLVNGMRSRWGFA